MKDKKLVWPPIDCTFWHLHKLFWLWTHSCEPLDLRMTTLIMIILTSIRGTFLSLRNDSNTYMRIPIYFYFFLFWVQSIKEVKYSFVRDSYRLFWLWTHSCEPLDLRMEHVCFACLSKYFLRLAVRSRDITSPDFVPIWTCAVFSQSSLV